MSINTQEKIIASSLLSFMLYNYMPKENSQNAIPGIPNKTLLQARA